MMPRGPPFLGSNNTGPIVNSDTTAACCGDSGAGSGRHSSTGVNARALVNARVRVKWKGTGRSQWYSGRIVGYNQTEHTHTVSYDDGETHAHHLGDLVWQVLAGTVAGSPAAGGDSQKRGMTSDSLLAGERHSDGHLGTVEGRDLFQEHVDEGYMRIISSPACADSQATLSDTGCDTGDESGSKSESESSSESESGGGSAENGVNNAGLASAPAVTAPPPAAPLASPANKWEAMAGSEPATEFTRVHPVAHSTVAIDVDGAALAESFEIVSAADAIKAEALTASNVGRAE